VKNDRLLGLSPRTIKQNLELDISFNHCAFET
jgi:hypothetical protein